MCSSAYHKSKMYKQQKEVCEQLRAENFKNLPRRESYTNHHWTHVVQKSETWKKKNTVKITDIVPHAKNLNKVLDNLERDVREMAEKNKRLKEKEAKKS